MTIPAGFSTADRIIKFAMEDAGLLQDGDEPTEEQQAKYLQRLNDVINFMQTQGLKLWLLVDTTVTLVAGQGTYALSPTGDVAMVKPLRVLQAYYRDADAIRRPLVALSWEEYLRLSQPTATGAINSYFVNKKQSAIDVSFWQVPDTEAATGTAHLLVETQVTNLVTLSDTMSFPQEWFMALRWGLAAEICTGQPGAVIERCEGKAAFYREALENWDVEDAATRFEPDARSQFYNTSFR